MEEPLLDDDLDDNKLCRKDSDSDSGSDDMRDVHLVQSPSNAGGGGSHTRAACRVPVEDSVLATWVQYFCPVLYLHPKESYWPTAMDFYLRGCEVWHPSQV